MRVRLLSTLVATLLWAGPAFAVPVQVVFSWGTGGTQGSNTYDAAQLGEADNHDGTFSYEGVANSAGWGLSWDVTVKPDPYIDGVFAVTNSTGSIQTYTVTFTLPVSPAISPASLSGASVAGTLTVNGGGGTLGHNAGAPMFTALIDGAPYDTLLPYDSSLTLPFGSGSTGGDSFGLPGLTQPGPAVNTSIGIQLTFTLTPGDSASFTSRFEVVPEPMTALMLGGGLVGLAVLGSRRR